MILFHSGVIAKHHTPNPNGNLLDEQSGNSSIGSISSAGYRDV